MNTQFIYISNIPSNIKPVLLLHELKNKWARMLYIENAFTGQRDAFVYNPTDNYDHFCCGVQNLRSRIIDGSKSLSVYFVWFPPSNVLVTTMIPAGAAMLPYLFVENLHKDVLPTEVIYDLPLQLSDVKNWDIPERSDKCVIIKLATNCSTNMRSFIISTLRSRPVRGVVVRASELIISDEGQLSSQMVPRSIKVNDAKHDSYFSNFFYLHDIPSTLTAKMLIETAKADSIRGVRVFFLEVNNNMKYGFLYVPRSLPSARFLALYDKMKAAQYTLLEFEIVRLKIEKTWFEPCGADPPCVKDETSDVEMVLTHYLYIYGVPHGVQVTQLSMCCPWPTKMYLFSVNEVSSQIGFVVLRGLGVVEVSHVIGYLRNLDFSGARVQVEEIYLQCHGLNSDVTSRPFQLQARKREVVSGSAPDSVMKRVHDNGDCVHSTSNGCTPADMLLSATGGSGGALVKTEFIAVHNVASNVSKAALIFDIGRVSDGCILVPNNGRSTAFLYYPGCDKHTWDNIINRLNTKAFITESQSCSLVCEVYLKTSFYEHNDGCQGVPQYNGGGAGVMVDTNIIFVYNVSDQVTECAEIVDSLSPQCGSSMIQYSELLETTATGSKSAFLLIRGGCPDADKEALLQHVRKIFVRHKPIYADVVLISPVVSAQINKKYRYQ